MIKLKIEIFLFKKNEAISTDKFLDNDFFEIKKNFIYSKNFQKNNEIILNALLNSKSDYFFFQNEYNKINSKFFNKLIISEKKNIVLTRSFYNLKNCNKFPSHSTMMQKKINYLENDFDYIFSCIFNTKNFLKFIRKFGNINFKNNFTLSYSLYLFFILSIKNKDQIICKTYFQQINENFASFYPFSLEHLFKSENILEILKINECIDEQDRKNFFLSFINNLNLNDNIYKIIKMRQKKTNSNFIKFSLKLLNNLLIIYDKLYSIFYKLYQKKYFKDEIN